MASFAVNTNYHIRSISLPSTCHPISAQFDEYLSRLISCEAASSSCSSISHNLNSLTGLYSSVDELLLLPVNQQIITKDSQAKWVDDVLEGSLKLLDVCGVARDALMRIKECLQSIQSVLRRRSSGDLSIAKEVAEYMDTRNQVRKAIKHCIRNMKKTDVDDKISATLGSTLRDVEAITADILKSLLSHVAGIKMQSRQGNLFARLLNKVSEEDQGLSGREFEDIDALLRSLISTKKSGVDAMHFENLRSQMVKLESEMQELDEELECLFRHLIKTRATFLNILSN